MIDKIKVNLSFYVYNTLLQDMIRFEFFKPSGEVNRNEFLLKVITNLYLEKMDKRDIFKKRLEEEAITFDISDKNKELIKSSAAKIMDDFNNEDLQYNYHEDYFMIYPTKSHQIFFDVLYEKEIKYSSSISSFIRNLLNEYAYLPQYRREYIARKDESILLKKSCEYEQIINFHVGKNIYILAPYYLGNNKEGTYSYLLGLDLKSKEKKPISIRMTKIKNLVITQDKYRFDKNEHEMLNNIISNGIEFASSEIIQVKIKASKTASKLFKVKSHNRPIIKHLEEDIYLVSCSLSNFINYFISFGKEITILDNEEIKANLLNFYKLAFEHYSK